MFGVCPLTCGVTFSALRRVHVLVCFDVKYHSTCARVFVRVCDKWCVVIQSVAAEKEQDNVLQTAKNAPVGVY
jgi:hypothetical protein